MEDDRELREALADLLTLEGYAVAQACDGKEALEILAQEGGWVILLDFRLPRVDGWAVLRALQTTPALAEDNRVILTSAHLSAGAAPALLGDLVGAALPKPFDPTILLGLLSRLA